MARFAKTISMAFLLFSAFPVAKAGEAGGNQYDDPLLLPLDPWVAKDMDLRGDQPRKIKDLQARQEKELKKIGVKGPNLHAKWLTLAKFIRKELAGILLKDQIERLGQLELQNRASAIFNDQKIIKELDITGKQITTIRKILETGIDKEKALFKETEGKFPDYPQQVNLMKRQLTQEAIKTLTKRQQEKWLSMAGEPFTGRFPIAGVKVDKEK